MARAKPGSRTEATSTGQQAAGSEPGCVLEVCSTSFSLNTAICSQHVALRS